MAKEGVPMARIFLLAAIIFSGLALHADGIFVIKPYAYTIKGEKWAVSWAYSSGIDFTDPKVNLYWKGFELKIDVTMHDGLYTALLPLPACGFGKVAYQVPGQIPVAKINNVPCSDDNRTTRFTFMADTQEGPKYDRVFAQLIKAFNGSAVLIGGDLVQTGDNLGDWINFFDALNPVFQTQFLIPVIGNHEYRHIKEVPYWKHFFQTAAAEDFYSINVGPAHIIAINSCFSDDSTLRVRQLPWLKAELEKPAAWKIIFFHHPAFSRSISNNPIAPKKEWKVLQEDYVPLFEQYHVDLVLNGHTHLVEHSFKNGVQYLTTGPAGGIMGTIGSSNPFTLESHMKPSIIEIELSKKQLRAVTTGINGKTLGDLIIKKD